MSARMGKLFIVAVCVLIFMIGAIGVCYQVWVDFFLWCINGLLQDEEQ